MADARTLIVAYCRDGDNDAFRRFYEAQSPKLWKFLIARGCDKETAYDLVSEAFLRFLQAVCRDTEYPVALLYRIAVNLRIDQHRRDRALPEDPSIDIDRVNVSAPSEPDEHSQIRGIVQNLPETERNLLLLRYWIGLSHKEVAQTLGVPEGTVRRQCAELLEKIRSLMSIA